MESDHLIPFFFKYIHMNHALITGASKGIGREIAFELARKKYNLVLVARSEDILLELCKQLEKEFGIRCHVIAADLTTEAGIDKTVKYVYDNSIALSILVNNAGYGLWGRFDETDLASTNALMKINIFLPVNITYRLLANLAQNKPSYILNIASTTAYQAIPKLAVYAACKTFVVQFSRALRYELKQTGISVTCVSPGTTESNFMYAAGMHSPHIRKKADKVMMKASTVAKFAVDSMFRKRNEVIPGWINKISVALIPFFPKAMAEKIAADIYKK